ncbi:MAG TPA: UDP binding domain-containing protein, partial [Allosphingosinicella sp.]
ADALVIVTEWNAFRALDLDRVWMALNEKVVVDLRNVYRSDEMEGRGFVYASVGRPTHLNPVFERDGESGGLDTASDETLFVVPPQAAE